MSRVILFALLAAAFLSGLGKATGADWIGKNHERPVLKTDKIPGALVAPLLAYASEDPADSSFRRLSDISDSINLVSEDQDEEDDAPAASASSSLASQAPFVPGSSSPACAFTLLGLGTLMLRRRKKRPT